MPTGWLVLLNIEEGFKGSWGKRYGYDLKMRNETDRSVVVKGGSWMKRIERGAGRVEGLWRTHLRDGGRKSTMKARWPDRGAVIALTGACPRAALGW